MLNENSGGITISKLVAKIGQAPEMADAPGGANPIRIFATMQALNKLDEIGIPAPRKSSDKIRFLK